MEHLLPLREKEALRNKVGCGVRRDGFGVAPLIRHGFAATPRIRSGAGSSPARGEGRGAGGLPLRTHLAAQLILQPVLSGGRKALVAAITSAKSFLSFMADFALPSIR